MSRDAQLPLAAPPETAATSTTSSDGARVVGLRVLRVLDASERRNVIVAHDDRGAVYVLKHWAAHDRQVDRELRALDRARGPHVVELIDTGDEGEGVAAVLARAERGDLADLLRKRSTLSPGELVTIVAPLATTLRRLHRAGVAHGRVTAQRVLFDTSGSPQLCGFGGALLFEPGLPPAHLERIAAVTDDRGAVIALARVLAERITGGAGRRVRVAIDRASADADDPLGRLADGLFAFSPGSPVRFPVERENSPEQPGLGSIELEHSGSGGAGGGSGNGSPRRIGPSRVREPSQRAPHSPHAPHSQRSPRDADVPRRGLGRSRRPHPDSGRQHTGSRQIRSRRTRHRADDARRRPREPRAGTAPRTGVGHAGLVGVLLDGAPGLALTTAITAVMSAPSTRRRRLGVGIVSGAAAAVLAFVRVPGPTSADTRTTTVDSSEERTGARDDSGSPASSHGRDADRPTGPSSGQATATGSASAQDDGDDGAATSTDDAVRGDDPLAAARALLSLRRDRLRELDDEGLAELYDARATALDDDRRLLARLDAGTADAGDRARVDLTAVQIGDALGDAVVIELTPDSDPASLLLMRGEAGWRIRAYSGTAG